MSTRPTPSTAIGYPGLRTQHRVAFPAGLVDVDTDRHDHLGREVVSIGVKSDAMMHEMPFVIIVDPRQSRAPFISAHERANNDQTIFLVRADHKHPIPARQNAPDSLDPLWQSWYGRAEDCPYCAKTLGEALIGSVVSILVEPFRDLPAVVLGEQIQRADDERKPSVLVNFTTVTAHRLAIPADTAIEVLEGPAAPAYNTTWVL